MRSSGGVVVSVLVAADLDDFEDEGALASTAVEVAELDEVEGSAASTFSRDFFGLDFLVELEAEEDDETVEVEVLDKVGATGC